MYDFILIRIVCNKIPGYDTIIIKYPDMLELFIPGYVRCMYDFILIRIVSTL